MEVGTKSDGLAGKVNDTIYIKLVKNKNVLKTKNASQSTRTNIKGI